MSERAAAWTVGAVDWVYLNPANETEVRAGDLISAEAGGMPIYQVMAIRDGRAWLNDLENGADRVTRLGTFPWKAVPRGR